MHIHSAAARLSYVPNTARYMCDESARGHARRPENCARCILTLYASHRSTRPKQGGRSRLQDRLPGSRLLSSLDVERRRSVAGRQNSGRATIRFPSCSRLDFDHIACAPEGSHLQTVEGHLRTTATRGNALRSRITPITE